MKSFLLLQSLFLFSTLLPAQSCPCVTQFDWLRQKLELNYSGYRDKVTPQNQADFEKHKEGRTPPLLPNDEVLHFESPKMKITCMERERGRRAIE